MKIDAPAFVPSTLTEDVASPHVMTVAASEGFSSALSPLQQLTGSALPAIVSTTKSVKAPKPPKAHKPRATHHAVKAHASKAPRIKVPKVTSKHATTSKASTPKLAASAVASAASPIGSLIQKEGVRVVGSILSRTVSSGITTAERLATARKLAEERVAGQEAAKAAAKQQAQAAQSRDAGQPATDPNAAPAK